MACPAQKVTHFETDSPLRGNDADEAFWCHGASSSDVTTIDNVTDVNNDFLVANVTDVTSVEPNATFDAHDYDFYQHILNTVVVPVLFSVISVVGVIGNSLVIYVILSNRRMTTVTNLLLLNLALADLSFVVVIPPFTAYEFVEYTDPRWPFGPAFCKILHYLVNVTAYVTVYTLVLISVVRFMTVVHSAATVHIRTKRNAVFMIGAIWVLVLVLNVPILSSYGLTDNGCDIYDVELGRRIFATFFAFAYVLPLLVIAMFYLCIVAHISRQRSESMIRRKRKSGEKRQQAGRLLILVVVLFAVLWLPIHVLLLVGYFGQPPDNNFFHTYSVLSSCFAYFNSCVNPIIYNRTSKAFREAFQEAIGCGKRQRRSLMVLARLQPMDPAARDCAPIVGMQRL